MKTQYWLPCACGQKLAVETTQAGQRVRCACGADVVVPPLREILELEPAVDAPGARPRRPQGAWGRRQTRLLIGAAIVIASLGGWGFLRLAQPRVAAVDTLSPIQVWTMWQDLRRGPDRNLTPIEQQIVGTIGMYRAGKIVLLCCAAAGLLFMAVSYALPAPVEASARAAVRRRTAGRKAGPVRTPDP